LEIGGGAVSDGVHQLASGQVLQEVVVDQKPEALQQVAVLLSDLSGQQLLQQGLPPGRQLGLHARAVHIMAVSVSVLWSLTDVNEDRLPRR